MFSKPLSSLTADDIRKVVADSVRESDVVEFKEAMSGKGGRDAWHDGAPKIGDAARDKIVNEVIAFANSHGGTLVLGIAESDDKPARAASIAPIQRCADLADRLARLLADTVEPPLTPFPVVAPVLISGDAGVVVFQIAASRNSPHRHRGSLESYVRRGEQAVQMTMREIQDLTLQVDRGLAGIERRFQNREDAAREWIPQKAGLTLRTTAIPLSPIEVPGVPGNASAYPSMHRVQGKFVGGGETVVQFPISLGMWRPILRGVQAEERRDSSGYRVQFHRDGVIDFLFSTETDERSRIHATWVMGVVCNALIAIERTRQTAMTPGLEYGLEFAILVRQRPLTVGAYRQRYDDIWEPINPPGLIFPRYSVGDRSTFDELLELIQRDFWNAAGHNLTDSEILKLELDPLLK